MAKLTLDFEEDYDFDLIGICSHSKDYRLVWELNTKLEYDFAKAENFDLRQKGSLQSHSFFEFIDEENGVEYFLINNRCNTGLLIPEEKSCDYLLVIKGHLLENVKEKITSQIMALKNVLTAYTINVENLRSKDNLLF